MRIFERALQQTRDARRTVEAELGPEPSGGWVKRCGTCGEGMIRLDYAETIKRRIRGESGALVWDGLTCEECDLRNRLGRSGVPVSLVTARFHNFDDGEGRDKARSKAQAFAATPSGFIILQSPIFGCGKSHLAVAIIAERVRLNRCLFVSHAEFLAGLRASYRSRIGSPADNASVVDLLVLDDVGVSVGGVDDLPALRSVLTERHAHKRPTVISTNLEAAPFTALLGEHLTSRLQESTFAWVVVPGQGRRPRKRAEYIGANPKP